MKAVFLSLLLWSGLVSGVENPKLKKIAFAQTARVGSLNPYLISGIDSFVVTGFVLETLTRVDPYTQNLQPLLAREWKINEKEKTLRVTLRKGVKFHNGQEFTAEDVRFTWASYSNPDYKGEIWRGMWDQVENVLVVEPYVVEFKFKTLTYLQFENVMVSLRILPKDYYSKVNHEEWSERLIGTGPYRIVRFEANKVVELEPNIDWWGWTELKIPVGQNLLVKTVTDSKAAKILIEKGELDLFQVPSGEAAIESSFLKTAATPFGQGMGFSINMRSPIFKDVRMRQALELLWNRQALNQKIYGGKYNLALDSFSPATYYYPTRKPTAYDPQAASKLLAKLGYKDEDQDSILEKDGKPLVLKIIMSHSTDQRWVGLFQSDAAKLGIQVRMERVEDESQWWHLLKQGKFDLATYDGPFSVAPYASVVRSNGAYNNTGLASDKVDRMIDRLEKEFRPSQRRRIFRQLIGSIRDLVIEVPGLYTKDVYYLASPDVTFDSKFPNHSWRWRKKD